MKSLVRLTVTPVAAQAMPDNRVEFVLRVQNTGATSDHYHIDIAGLPRGWYTLAETTVALESGESTSVPLVVHPVAGAMFTGGRYPFKAQVVSDMAPALRAAAIVDLTVGAATGAGTSAGDLSAAQATATALPTDGAPPAAYPPARSAPPATSSPDAPTAVAGSASTRPSGRPARGAPLANISSPRSTSTRGEAASSGPSLAASRPTVGSVPTAGLRLTTPTQPDRQDAGASPTRPVTTGATPVGATTTVLSPASVTTSALHHGLRALTSARTPPHWIATWVAIPILVALLGAGVALTLRWADTGPTVTTQARLAVATVAPATAAAVATAAMAAIISAVAPTASASTALATAVAPTASASTAIATAVPTALGIGNSVVVRAPVIGRFTRIDGHAGQPDMLVWSTRNATRVTLDGVPVSPQGRRLLRVSVEGAAYRLDAWGSGHMVTAQIRVERGGAAVPAASAPVALVDRDALRFGPQVMGPSARARAIRIVNLGPGGLGVLSVAVGGRDPGDFRVRTTCGAGMIATYASCSINVVFTPTVHGMRYANLIVADTTATSPHIIALSGRGR